MRQYVLFLVVLSFGVSSWTAKAGADVTADIELRNIFKSWEKPVNTDIDGSDKQKGEPKLS